MPAIPTILDLSDDDTLHLLTQLDIPTLLQLRQVSTSQHPHLAIRHIDTITQVCRRMYALSRTKELWVNLYLYEVTDRNLPFAPYWKSLDDLGASELETLVLHAMRLESKVTVLPKVVQFNQKRSVTWIQMLQSQWLLVASSDDVCSVISLWSVTSLLTSQSPAPFAEAFLCGPVMTGAVDVGGSSVTIALELRGRSELRSRLHGLC